MYLANRRLRAVFFLCLSIFYSLFWWSQEGWIIMPVMSSRGFLQGRVICIDPGHGGRDPGAVAGRVKEKDMNLDIARKLAKSLQREGARVFMTRTGDKGRAVKPLQGSFQLAELNQRARLVKDIKAHVFISVHCNSDPQSMYYGPQTFYKEGSQRGASLARFVQLELVGIRKTNRRAIPGRYYLLNNSAVPAVIVEVGYLSNKGDLTLLGKEGFRQSLAEAITRGVINFYRD